MTMQIATNTETTEIAPTTPGLKRLEAREAPPWVACVDPAGFIVTVNVGDSWLRLVARVAALGRTSRVGMVVIVKA